MFYEDLNAAQLAPTFSINLSGTYRFQPKNKQWRMFMGFSVINLLNQENAYTRNYTVVPPRNGQESEIESADKVHLRFTPNFSWRVEW